MSLRHPRHLVRYACVAIASVIIATPLLAIGAATNTTLGSGDTLSVTCSGTKLTVTKESRTSDSLACTGTVEPPPTTTTPPVTTVPPPPTTTPPPPTTIPVTPPPSGSWWIPGTGQIEWQWELDHPLSLSSASDMGTGQTTYTGAPAATPTVYDIDGIDNPSSTVSALHVLGDHVVCYVETGDVGNYYSASDEGIPTTYYAQFSAAGDLGTKQQGWPEYYLNINAASTLSIVESMIKQQCSAKGFDAVETDNDETWQYSTGFSITEANDETYMTAIANYVHSLGMAWFIKNPDDVGNPSFSDAMAPYADAVISEQCNEYATCSDLGNLIGKVAVFNAEYTPTNATSFCPSDNAKDFNGELFDVNLDGKTRISCR